MSIVAYTGNGTGGATIPHSLGVTPRRVIVKARSAVGDWIVYHSALGATKYLYMNTTAAAVTSTTAWNDTAPT